MIEKVSFILADSVIFQMMYILSVLKSYVLGENGLNLGMDHKNWPIILRTQFLVIFSICDVVALPWQTSFLLVEKLQV